MYSSTVKEYANFIFYSEDIFLHMLKQAGSLESVSPESLSDHFVSFK